jgi:hypothetical protein
MVSDLMALHAAHVVYERLPDQLLESVALIGPPLKSHGSVQLGYHYAYTHEDYRRDETTAGLLIANAIIRSGPEGFSLPRHTTRRIYQILISDPSRAVTRQDYQDDRPLIAIPLEEQLRAPLGIELPEDDFVTASFKHDIHAIGIAKPVRPATNLLPIHLSLGPKPD